MARPLKQGMDYFPHDTDASNDEKIDRLRMLYGNDGYAFYFILLERIYRSANFEIDVSDAETIQILARKVEVTKEKFAEMLQTALKSGCFCQQSYTERGVLTSDGIKKRTEAVAGKRVKMAERYRNGVSAAETQQKPDKVKESKVKEKSIEKTALPTGFSFPEYWTPAMIKAYQDEWLPFRQARKPKLETVSIQKQINSLSGLNESSLLSCLNSSISNGYQGLFPEKFIKATPIINSLVAPTTNKPFRELT